MLANRTRKIVAAALAAVFIVMVISPALYVDAVDVSGDINIGPYVDKVVFQITGNPILALLAGDVDLMDGFFNPVHYQTFNDDPDISIFNPLRNGYGHITINCRKYPLNISGFRRAFAYAFDKTRVTAEIMDGFSREHDSLVPYPNEWCIEDNMPYHYYTAQVDTGNAILDNLNFSIDPVSGFRNAPDGTPFTVVIEYGASSPEIAGGTAYIGVDALLALHVNAETRGTDASDFISRIDSHGEYDMAFYAINFPSYDVDRLVYDYCSEYADQPFQNPSNFVNETFDSWRNQLLYNTSYESVYEAAAAMQMILHENVPRLVVYENIYLQAYRNDVFTGHIEDIVRHIAGPWSLRKIHKIDGTSGGTIRVSIGEPRTFNCFYPGGGHSNAILDNLWPTLFFMGPDAKSEPYLAKNLLTETHADNPSVADGHTRFTIDIVQNATWSDGTSLTADDVAFTFTYVLESGLYGNPAASRLSDLMSATALTPTRLVLEFNTESYWHIPNFAYLRIIPKHIFNDVDGIGYAGWNTWNPVFDPAEPYVTSGPFNLTDIEVGEFVELTNPDFWYYPDFPETTPNTAPPTTEPDFNLTLAISAGAVGAAVVILVGGVGILKLEKKGSN